MSYWDVSPGPRWSDFWKTYLPFSGVIKPFIFDKTIIQRKKTVACPPDLLFSRLTEEDSEGVAELLKLHYQTFPRSKICLSAARIRNGFSFDGWMGCGVKTKEGQLVGSVISRSLGTLQIGSTDIPEIGVVDFFCVATDFRKRGVASFLLQELTHWTASKNRLVHIFIKEGFPLSPLPPIWQSSYIVRKRGLPDEKKKNIEQIEFFHSSKSESFNYLDCIPRHHSIFNVPTRNPRDSHIYKYQDGTFLVYLCITDTFHRSVPEAWKLGELVWIVPTQEATPRSILTDAIETLVDNCMFDLILMDTVWPHDTRRGWKKDATYGWYLFNCHPGTFFGLKPYWTF